MKKTFLVLTVMALGIITVQAQKVALLAKAGANFTKIDGKEFKDGYSTGFHAGGALEIGLTKTIGLQPEVLFSQVKTSSISTAFAGFNANNEVKLDYLSIPLLLRINATKLLTIHVGPEYSILISNDKDLLQNGQAAFKSGNFAMIGGVQLNLKSTRLYGRYNVGLSSIEDAPNADKWKSQQIQIGLAFNLL